MINNSLQYSFVLLLILLIPFFSVAQAIAPKYAKVKISLQNHSLKDVEALGLAEELDDYVPKKQVTTIYSAQELAVLDQAGIPYTILIEDMTAHFLERVNSAAAQPHYRGNEAAAAISDYPTPLNYPKGSMSGYLTYEQLLDNLDKMSALYPHLISTKTAIGDHKTAEGRPIHYLRISDNPNIVEGEPEVLYTSLTHAREPNSMQQMIFFMWYVLENYDTNEEIKQLLDNTQLYFVPCVNPDGYVYNERTNPNGGGYWRKNRWRDEFNRAYGVDLNRNFGYEWGLDNGSSDDPNRGNYRGTAPFSEPEIAALSDLCTSHQFQIALNYHSTGEVLIFPWGFDRTPTADAKTFHTLGGILTQENNYRVGASTEIISYPASGISDDWMYGATESKNKIFAMTPELGTQHWVPYEQVLAISKASVWQNIAAAHLVHKYFTVEKEPEQVLARGGGTVDLSIFQAGLKEGVASFRVEALTENVLITSPGLQVNTQHSDTIAFAFDYHIPSNIEEEQVAFELIMENGLFAQRQRLEYTVAIKDSATVVTDSTTTTDTTNTGINKELETFLFDDFSTTDNWYLSGDWGLCNNTYVSAGTSLCDSPNGSYLNNATASITIKEPFLLRDIEEAYLRFHAQWNLEENRDYVVLSIARAGYPFKVVKTYTGVQQNWIVEDINLMEYVSDYVYLRFQIFTDGTKQADGFYLDDLSIEVLRKEEPLTVAPTKVRQQQSFIKEPSVQPNPFKAAITYTFEATSVQAPIQVRIFDTMGRTLQTIKIEKPLLGVNQLHLTTAVWESGIYFIQMEGKKGVLRVVKL